MSNTALHQLATRSTRWDIPQFPDYDDPSWEQVWTTATEQGKGNLARAWLWTTTEQMRATTSSSLQWEFLKFTFQHLAWVRQVQPYLDSAFWVTCRDTVEHELRTYLDTSYANTGETDEHADLRALLFGEPKTQVQVLKRILGKRTEYGTDSEFWYFMFELSMRLTQGDSALLPELAFVAYKAGYYEVDLPQLALPEACTWYYLGALERQAHRAGSKTRRTAKPTTVPPRAELKRQVQAMPSTVVARFLLYYAPDNIAEDTRTGEQRLYSSFLLENTADDCSMALVFAEWMPDSAAVWNTAHALGLPPLEVCAQLATGNPVTATCTLPSNLTVEPASPL